MAAPTKFCDVKIPLANPEPSTHEILGPSEHEVGSGKEVNLQTPGGSYLLRSALSHSRGEFAGLRNRTRTRPPIQAEAPL
jgi:hypothetical protein